MNEAPASAPIVAPPSSFAPEVAARLHQDIKHLSETIGPRGSATDDEAKAAHYVAERLTALGLDPQRQDFKGAASAYAPYVLAMAFALLSLFLFWQQHTYLTVFAIVFTATVLASLLKELSFKDNPLRWVLYKENSLNVYAEIKAKSETPQSQIIITTHLDTHRTPLVFSSPGWLRLFQRLLPLGMGSLVLLLAWFLVGLVTGLETLRWVALLPGACVLLIFGLMLQADQTPFSKGANDNASGVAVGLELASRLAQSPLEQHGVTLVFTGCEEVACYGADAFMRKWVRVTSPAPIHFVIDQVGGKGADPCIIRGEQFLRSAPCNPALLAIADEVMTAHPELHAHIRSLNTAYSELSIGALHGLRTIGLGSLTQNGMAPHWHQPTDTIDNIDPDVAARAAELAWLFLQAIDKTTDDEVKG